MIEVRLKICDLDYTAAIDSLMPMLIDKLSGSSNPIVSILFRKTKGLHAAVAKSAMEVLPKDTKDELVAVCLNHYNAEISQTIVNLAAQRDIHLNVESFEVAASG